MPERLPFSILTFDNFQGEYIDEDISGTYATYAEAEFEANYLLENLLEEQQTEPVSSEEVAEDPTYTLYIVGQQGERTFYTRG